jgi:outer membrane receptor protein involved in Fe transport
MFQHKVKSAAALCVSLVCGTCSQLAIAQQSHSDGTQLEEIVVTAEKRETTIEKTAISLTAVSGADIVNRGFTDLASLMQTVPGVSIRTSGPGMTEFEMRGVASNGGNSPTVGFYFDETPLTAPAATNEGKIVISPDLYDLNRVEVLRGPQGTLYGSGSMGGTIRIIPNAPNPEAIESTGEAKFADTDHGGFDHAENAMLNLPFLNGIAAVRIVGSYSFDAGWIDRVVTEPGTFPIATNNNAVRGNVLAAPIATEYHDVNDVEKTTVRISAIFKPIDGLTITPSYFYQKMRAGGLPYIDSVPGTDAHYQPFDIAENYRDEFHLSALSVKYRTDAFEISSASAYWTRHEPLIQDASESWTTGISLPSYGPGNGGIGAAYADEDNQSHQTTEELRISSVGDTRLKWLAGYFYSDFESGWDIVFPSQTGEQVFGTSNSLFDYYSPFKILQQSVFGEVTYNITEPFAVTVGARRYHYDAPVGLNQYGALLGTLTPVTTSTSENAQGVTPKVSLSYQFDKDLLVYATAAKGFRPGGGTGPVPTTGPPGVDCEAQLQQEYGSKNGAFVSGPISFSSDSVWSYELGEKWRSDNGRVSVNAAGYFETWTGVQQVNALSSCGYVYTANVGDAHVKGGEIEARGIVVPDLEVSGSVTFSQATLTSATLLDSGFNPGTAIQQVPRWSGSAQIAYHHELNDDLSVIARAETNYVGSRTDETYATNTLPSYQLTNIRGGFEGPRWSAVLFVNNVADKRALLNNITQDAENLPDFNRVAVSQPRTAGVDLNYKFK